MASPLALVGGGLGSVRVAEFLRGNGFDAPITIVSEEAHPPYDRPPLSKSVLAGDDDRVDLKPAGFYDDAGIELRLRTRAIGVEASSHVLTCVRDGVTSCLDYRTLVLATGLAPRPFPGDGGGLPGVHLLRTYDDAVALRAELAPGRRAVVVGAGFIGCEAAATMSGLGVDVTVVEPAPAPMAAALGTTVGALVGRLHKEAAVDVRTGTGVRRLVPNAAGDRVGGVELGDGTMLPADVVLVGIGGVPDLDWLDGSSIATAPVSAAGRGGILCDDAGRTSAPDVYALGDVANWERPQGHRHRVEHWNHTVDQAAVVAAAIGGTPSPPPAVPYFWSDQYGLKIQLLGAPRADDDVYVIDDDGRRFLAYYARAGLLTGVVGAGRAGRVMKMRSAVSTPTPVDEVLP
ncbi:MAG: FAD-dependent oxidoreductase [Gordonia sp. (in: high G+C Gram-positive bacteria)]